MKERKKKERKKGKKEKKEIIYKPLTTINSSFYFLLDCFYQ